MKSDVCRKLDFSWLEPSDFYPNKIRDRTINLLPKCTSGSAMPKVAKSQMATTTFAKATLQLVNSFSVKVSSGICENEKKKPKQKR